MERRVFLAILLSFAVLFAYQAFFAPPLPQAPARESTTAPSPETPAQPAAPAEAAAADPAADVDAAEPLVADTEAREVVVETETVRAVFSTRGAVLTNWILKDYAGSGGQPLDLVPTDLPADAARPFAVRTGDAAVDRRLDTALFRPSESLFTPEGGHPIIEFEYRDASGLAAHKRFTFNAGDHPYVVEAVISVERAGADVPFRMAFGPSLGDGHNTTGSSYYYPPAALYSDGSDVERLAEKHIVAQPRYQGPLRWAGVSDHYFLAAVLGGDQPVDVTFTPANTPVPGDPATMRTFVSWEASAQPGSHVSVYLGPKEFDLLKAADPTLPRAIDFGILAFLVVPLLTALKWVHGFVGNWGWSIIVLTLLINALMAPLRHKSLVSMRKLQKLQPEIKVIQKRYEKYKMTDPERQKMNTEMMALYRERGVNPASGCLPMLMTMPVLFAFYSLLSVAIELRGAPWIGWIQDLSAHDPYYITPLLMGGTMFWQQYITPTTADPVQQKMMLLMPAIFMVMFLWFPSGLVLYWLFSNLWAIGQQMVTNRFAEPVPARVADPPAVRRVKKPARR